MNFRTRHLALIATAVISLVACGGGGGGDEAPATHVLAGTITVAPTAAVDSDSNDVNQVKQSAYADNSDVARSQPLTSPVLLAGTVNEPGFGPAGNNFNGGDLDDWYSVDLVAGQVVELEFAADPADNDVDLYLYSQDTLHTGTSNGATNRYECVQVGTSGRYFIDVSAFRGATIYNLKIGAPGSAASCTNATTSAPLMAGQLLAKARRTDTPTSQALATRITAAGVRGAQLATKDSAAPLPHLLQLPASATERSAGLSALAGHPATQSIGQRPAALATAAGSAIAERAELLKYAKRLQATGAFEYVQPNWLNERTATVGTFPPNDRAYSYQRWHYEQINLPAAMSRINGLAAQPALRPIVAVIDDGIVIDHPDLAPQLFSPGRAFISRNSEGDNNLPSANNISTKADNPAFHGTHVAGTVGAATFDGIGGAGTAPMALILPLRVFPPSGGAGSIDIINAMLYAARLPNNSGLIPARRADVINMSLGGDRACDRGYQDAINQVRAAGVIVVVAAGNSGHNDRGQRAAVGAPANCSGAIAVSALDAQKGITPYSNTGAQIVVAAPGGDASKSTTGTGAPDNVYSDVATFDELGNRQPAFGGMQGTSMASPHVAGVMALMRYVNPALTPANIDAMFSSGALTDDLGSAGRDIDFGWGLINANKAVNAALAAGSSPPPAPAGQVVADPSGIDFGSFQSSAALDLVATGTTAERVASVTSDNANVTVAATSVDATTKLGRYTVSVNRAALAVGTIYPKLTVTLTPARSFTVQLTVTKAAGGSTTAQGNYGPIYVLLVDPATQEVVDSVVAQHAAGHYTWRATGVKLARVSIVAGGDLDNDDVVCQRGEPCGAYPVLAPGSDLSVIELGSDRSDIDFQVAPLSGMSVLRVGGGATTPGWRRRVGAAARSVP